MGRNKIARRDDIRNIVIIAHVDHGKTTLVDCLLRQSGQFRDAELRGERILDTSDLERERGITIVAKNIALSHKGVKINVIDTPGHADFGGEVERVLRMADGALLLVDAAEGPMPQTRFVLSKALECGLQPIVVINKIDRPDARSHAALDETFELLMELAHDDQLEDLPHVFTTAKNGYATADPDVKTTSMELLLDLVLEKIPGPEIEPDAPLRMLVTTIDWSQYVGRIAIGRVTAGTLREGQTVGLSTADGRVVAAQISTLMVFDKLGRIPAPAVQAGDIAAVVGLTQVEIGDTICDLEHPAPLPRLVVDQPTLEMIFTINSSPFAGRDGKYVTSRQLRERLYRELERNVALRVEPVNQTDGFAVAGRGVLHLAILIETMRREGYEFSVGKPRVIFQYRDGVRLEPFETLTIEVPPEHFGRVMDLTGQRRGQLEQIQTRGDYSCATFRIPARGLIGLRTMLLNATQGTALVYHRFAEYAPSGDEPPHRANGVLVSTVTGRGIAYALGSLQERAELFVGPGDDIYEGMIVGENSRENDMMVNPAREKKLTNMRAAGNDENILLKPARRMSLETALEYIEDDELVEITPHSIRLRKMLLTEVERRRQVRRSVPVRG